MFCKKQYRRGHSYFATKYWPSTALLLVALGTLLSAKSLATEAVKTPSFIEAKTIKRGVPEYPTSQRASNNAGVVELLMMVTPEGKPFEPMVVHSTKPQFEKAALNVIDDYHFSPALLNGEPVESSYSLRIVFSLLDAEKSKPSKFASRYRAAKAELDKPVPDQENAKKKIRTVARSNNLNPYAYTQLNQLRYLYAGYFGGIREQIDAIETLLLFEGRIGSKGRFVDEELRLSMRQKLFELNVQAERFGDAISAYNVLQQIDPQAEQKYGEDMKKIRQIRSSEEEVMIDLKIHARGYASLNLFKDVFSLQEIDGKLQTLKLRCLNKFAAFPTRADYEYRVPDGPGYCNLQVLGEPGTTFKLAQR